MADIFISYTHADKALAAELAQSLEADGFKVWWDHKLISGSIWDREIDEKLKEVFAVILMITPNTVKSDYVNYEWAFALGANIQVIPYIKDKSIKLPSPLTRLQWVEEKSKLVEDLHYLKRVRDARQEVKATDSALVKRFINVLDSDRSNDDELRRSIIKALGFIGNEDAVQTLSEIMVDNQGEQNKPHVHVRAAAAEAVGLIRDERSVDKLRIVLLEQGESRNTQDLRDAAYQALLCIGTEKALNVVREYDDKRKPRSSRD